MHPGSSHSDAKRIRDALAQGWTGEKGLERTITRLVEETRTLQNERIGAYIDGRFPDHIVAQVLSSEIRGGLQ